MYMKSNFKDIVSHDYNRVTTCLENLEMSGNLVTVRELSGNKPCHGKGHQKPVVTS